MNCFFQICLKEIELKITKVAKKSFDDLFHRFDVFFKRQRAVKNNLKILDTFKIKDDRATQVCGKSKSSTTNDCSKRTSQKYFGFFVIVNLQKAREKLQCDDEIGIYYTVHSVNEKKEGVAGLRSVNSWLDHLDQGFLFVFKREKTAIGRKLTKTILEEREKLKRSAR